MLGIKIVRAEIVSLQRSKLTFGQGFSSVLFIPGDHFHQCCQNVLVLIITKLQRVKGTRDASLERNR